MSLVSDTATAKRGSVLITSFYFGQKLIILERWKKSQIKKCSNVDDIDQRVW